VSSRAPATDLIAAVGFGLATLAAASLGGLATANAVEGWYRTLEKPSWNPPDATFGIVWTALYVMIAVAGWLAWRADGLPTVVPWAVQLVLNAGWAYVFFGLRRPGWALVEILVLLAAIVWTLVVAWRADRTAGLLLVPYLAWVAFAAVLNAAIVRLNP
jgi:benzodiazapine receptor